MEKRTFWRKDRKQIKQTTNHDYSLDSRIPLLMITISSEIERGDLDVREEERLIESTLFERFLLVTDSAHSHFFSGSTFMRYG